MTTDYSAHVALDWGDKTHAFALQPAQGTSESGTIEANPEALHGWLEQLHARTGGGLVALALESGKNGLLHALLGYPWLHLYPVHPAASQRFRTAFVPSGAKDDVPDAQILLTLLLRHRDQLRRLEPEDPATRRLAALVEARRHLVDQRTRFAQELTSALKLYFPQALELMGDDHTASLALDFLARWPDLASAQAARPATLRSFYFSHNVRRPDPIEARLECLRKARPLTTDPVVIETSAQLVQALIAVLRPLDRQVREFDSRIQEAFAAHPDAALFRNLPGAGPALAPRLLVAFGANRSRYPNASSLQKYAGIAPVREKSGRQLWVHWRWNAPKFLRQTFVEWAGSTVVHSAWARAYYQQQRRAGKRRQAALRALAFKWIRIVWRCWQTRTPYDEARYINALSRRQSPLAIELAPS